MLALVVQGPINTFPPPNSHPALDGGKKEEKQLNGEGASSAKERQTPEPGSWWKRARLGQKAFAAAVGWRKEKNSRTSKHGLGVEIAE